MGQAVGGTLNYSWSLRRIGARSQRAGILNDMPPRGDIWIDDAVSHPAKQQVGRCRCMRPCLAPKHQGHSTSARGRGPAANPRHARTFAVAVAGVGRGKAGRAVLAHRPGVDAKCAPGRPRADRAGIARGAALSRAAGCGGQRTGQSAGMSTAVLLGLCLFAGKCSMKVDKHAIAFPVHGTQIGALGAARVWC